MNLIMFDIDGTLVEPYESDSTCFERAVYDVLDIRPDTHWSNYAHVTYSGILNQIISVHRINDQQALIHSQVKKKFIEYLNGHLHRQKVKEIEGASDFIKLLKSRRDVVLSIATGGWEESAKLKLHSAGIDFSDMVMASCSDHFDRAKIMAIAESKLDHTGFASKSYFGDGFWDKKATEKLGYNFILVGNRFEYNQQIDNYKNAERVLSYVGLSNTS